MTASLGMVARSVGAFLRRNPAADIIAGAQIGAILKKTIAMLCKA
jgi:hypothetical protein